MDRNQVTGFILIFLILVVWSVINQPTEEEIQQAREKERIALEERERKENEQAVKNSINSDAPANTDNVAITPSQLGGFSTSTGNAETVILENDVVKVALSSKGARLQYAELKEHFKILSNEGKEKAKIPVRLFEDEKNKFNYQLSLRDRFINTEDLIFSVSKSSNKVAFRATNEEGGYIEQEYSLGEGYNLEYTFKTAGLQNQLDNSKPINLQIVNFLDAIEENRMTEKMYSAVYFKEEDRDPDDCGCRGDAQKNLEGKPVRWTSFANQFFNTAIIAKGQPFDGLVTSVEALDKNESGDLERTTADLSIPYNGGSSESFAMDLYVGPNEYKTLKSYDVELETVIPYGNSIFGDINRHFIRPFFDWLSQFISSKGLVIILLIFVIKMALYPLTYKMLHSQAKMGALKPQLAGLKDKYKDDAQKVQMETMKIYREYGVSPLGGCFPMIAQIPIWYALFRFFPASITFRQEPFLWAHDLSSYDVLFRLPFEIPAFGAHLSLFTLLWAISQLIYTYYNSRHMDMSANPAMKYVQYFMPVMFVIFFNNYASGLTCYMLFSTLFNIAQTVVTKKFVFDEEKILAELNVQKAKPKKKNSFQSRLEEAMKRQQEMQRQKDAQAKKKKK